MESESGERLGTNRSEPGQQEGEKAAFIRSPWGLAGGSPVVREVGGHDEGEQG